MPEIIKNYFPGFFAFVFVFVIGILYLLFGYAAAVEVHNTYIEIEDKEANPEKYLNIEIDEINKQIEELKNKRQELQKTIDK